MHSGTLEKHAHYFITIWTAASGQMALSYTKFRDPCVNTTENGNKCAPQTIIDATMAKYKNFYLRTVFSNPVINPNEVDYLKYYL